MRAIWVGRDTRVVLCNPQVRGGQLVTRIEAAGSVDAGARVGEAARYKIAVLIPCYNEEVAVATVVKDFRTALPEANRLRLRQ